LHYCKSLYFDLKQIQAYSVFDKKLTMVFGKLFSSFAICTSVLSLLLFSPNQQLSLVSALPTGAGGCARDDAGSTNTGAHNFRPVTTGLLSDKGLQVFISPSATDPLADGSIELEQDESPTLQLGVRYWVHLVQPNGVEEGFRGFLFRLESQNGVDTTAALSAPDTDPDARLAAETCISVNNVGGVTHKAREFDQDPLTEAVALLVLDEADEDMFFDVTAVIWNRELADGTPTSEYYYTPFLLTAAEAAPGEAEATPTTAPGEAEATPTAAPGEVEATPTPAPVMGEPAPTASGTQAVSATVVNLVAGFALSLLAAFAL
jgi:hypothetical protein